MKNPLKKYICIKQHDIKDCGAACLATISKQYGLKSPISKIREVAGTDKEGTSAYGLIKAAQQLDFMAKGVKVSKPKDKFLYLRGLSEELVTRWIKFLVFLTIKKSSPQIF